MPLFTTSAFKTVDIDNNFLADLLFLCLDLRSRLYSVDLYPRSAWSGSVIRVC